jgi:sugar transferase EpsL
MELSGAVVQHPSTQSRVKRSLDVLVSLAVVLLGFPLIASLFAGILLTLGRPVLFRQPRIGYRGEVFVLLKFRTMSNLRGRDGRLAPDAMRLTRFGRFLRRFSLDELPELINVLNGQMTLVGPRPLLVEYKERYTPEQWRRHDVRPGLVGPVAAYGRNALTWTEKFDLDLWYVENWSLWLDLKLLVISILRAVTGAGVSAEGHATMPRFGEDEDPGS